MFTVCLHTILNTARHMWRDSRFDRNRHRPVASVLTLVLIVLSSLVVVAAGLGYRTRIELKLANAHAKKTRAYYLALGGLARIKALMTGTEFSPQRVAALGQFVGTAEAEGLFDQFQGSGVETSFLAYRVRDEQGYLNVNTSDPAAWLNVEGMDSECVACILDWIDADDNLRSQGAEADFYGRLDQPYATKNQPCVVPKELIYVRPVTRASYMGDELANVQDTPENETDGLSLWITGRQEDDQNLGLLNLFTVYGDGRVNINTVGEEILSALPGIDEQATLAVLMYRAGGDGMVGTDDDVTLRSAQELMNIETLTSLQIELLGQYCCFESQVFRAFSLAKVSDGFACGLMATVSVSAGQPKILYAERLR